MNASNGKITSGRDTEAPERLAAAQQPRPNIGDPLSRKAWLALKQQELVAPAVALRDLSEMLCKDAADHGLADFLRDLQQMHGAALRLLTLIEEVLNPLQPTGSDEEFARSVRHDLCMPLSEIIGLGEMWLEESTNPSIQTFTLDLQQVLTVSHKLVQDLGSILEHGAAALGAEVSLEQMAPEEAGVIRDLVGSLPAPGGGKDNHPCGSGCILVIDDNVINRDVLARRLQRDGHTVLTAGDGREGLTLARERDCDLILLDILMPELNGLQVLEQLKADQRLCHIPVIMISAFHELDSVVRCLEMGAEDYLAKPFNPVLLRARIEGCLEKKRLRDREVSYLKEIDQQRRRADELLRVILPDEVVRELKETNQTRPRRHEEVAVLFCDIVGFTPYCDLNSPEEVVAQLQQLVEEWETILLRHEVQKIKTIGDALMAAAGLLLPSENPVLQCLRCGLDLIAACRRMPNGWDLRVGVHVGPVMAGVIGRRQYLFDLWGDTVNTAARMESNGSAGAVTLSAAAWERVARCCRGESRGQVQVKGKGSMELIRFIAFLES